MSDDHRFHETGRTHKLWYKRLKLIDEMADWVFENLDLSKRDVKETEDKRRDKAYQYVYEHMAVGKMEYPLDNRDSLFTFNTIRDNSMINMLIPGLYPDFQVLVRDTVNKFTKFDPDDAFTVTMEDAKQGLNDAALRSLDKLETQLMEDKPGRSKQWYDDQMIGLILRYKCMGGFSDNLHGSVPESWSRELPDYIECFASPFNHKFSMYFSIYEEDRVFGSRGSFFTMIEHKRGILPKGRYEINPPWNNDMYERLVTILDRSLPRNDITAIIVGPYWNDAHWCNEGFSELITMNSKDYGRNSFMNVNVISYVNDAKKQQFSLQTAYWVFSRHYMEPRKLSRLRLHNQRSR